jgi:hypothetical protein
VLTLYEKTGGKNGKYLIQRTSLFNVQLFEYAFQQYFRAVSSKMTHLRAHKFALTSSSQFLCALHQAPRTAFGDDLEIHDLNLQLFTTPGSRKREISLAVKTLNGRKKSDDD